VSDSEPVHSQIGDIRPQDPPRSLGKMLLRMGPGMIIAAAVVGSGELILTPRTGAEAGFTLLWIILLGCVSKVLFRWNSGDIPSNRARQRWQRSIAFPAHAGGSTGCSGIGL